MKRSLLLMLLLATPLLAWDDDKPGPMGPMGAAGAPGVDATTQGSNWHVDVGAGFRLYDAKYWSANAFALKDVNHTGGIVGGLVMVGLGKSYADRQIEALRRDLGMTQKALAESIENQPKHVTIQGGSK
jgi:hypothetical protein